MDSGGLLAGVHEDDRFIKDRGVIRFFFDHREILLRIVFFAHLNLCQSPIAKNIGAGTRNRAGDALPLGIDDLAVFPTNTSKSSMQLLERHEAKDSLSDRRFSFMAGILVVIHDDFPHHLRG
jgi:hypothetical protein